MSYSNCCGASPKSNGDSDSKDYGICPECGEHCEYIDEEDEEKPFVFKPFDEMFRETLDGLKDLYSSKKQTYNANS